MITGKDKQFLGYYEKYKNKIFNYFWYRVNFNRDLAEDLTSEVFLKAYDKYDQYDQNRPFQGWVFAIAHNHLVNFYKSSPKVISLEDEIAKNIEANNQNIENRLDMQNIVQEIYNLPDYQKEVLTLRYVNELSNSEIAEIMGKDETTIRVAIHRALNLLRNKLPSPNE